MSDVRTHPDAQRDGSDKPNYKGKPLDKRHLSTSQRRGSLHVHEVSVASSMTSTILEMKGESSSPAPSPKPCHAIRQHNHQDGSLDEHVEGRVEQDRVQDPYSDEARNRDCILHLRLLESGVCDRLSLEVGGSARAETSISLERGEEGLPRRPE